VLSSVAATFWIIPQTELLGRLQGPLVGLGREHVVDGTVETVPWRVSAAADGEHHIH
jgi:hypothetical protein